MKIGFIGLGRMGSNMVLNLLGQRHTAVIFNRSPGPTKKLAQKGATPSYSIKELCTKLPQKKIIWLMIPAGKPIDSTITELLKYLAKGDVIIDGGNSYYTDSIKKYNLLKKRGIHFLDCGTSGGIEGARNGACMMIGGDKRIFKNVEKLFKDMTVPKGYGYMGKSGAGHFVKMVHNGIEYGMMGAIAEGLETVEKNKKRYDLDISEVIKVYSHGSIIESRLMGWLEKAWKEDAYLKSITGAVPKGETEDEMKKLETHNKMPLLHQARLMRVNTRKKQTLAGKMISAMRNQFGGHKANKSKRRI